MSNHAAESAAPDLLRTEADLALIERTPWQERIPARNTYGPPLPRATSTAQYIDVDGGASCC